MENTEYFDIVALLKLSNLRLRYVADTYALSVDEYFSMLSNFLVLAPSAQRALRRFESRDGDKEDYKDLDCMVSFLKELGWQQFIPVFYRILGAYDTGNWKLASYHAGKTGDEFKEFCSKITAARKTKKADSLPDTNIPLKEYIKNLDKEEENRKLIILAVDDSPVILKSVSAVLSDIYKVFMLPKPKEIRSVLANLTPELFLLDYQMPELDGFELVPIIRSYEEHKDTPIIYLTSVGTIDNVTAALALGASDFVIKPFNPDVLREKIARHIVRKKSF